MRNHALIVALGVIMTLSFGSDSAGEDLVIRGGKLHTITQGVIEKGDMLIHDGKIVSIGSVSKIPSQATLFDARGWDVFPGPIDAFTNLGASDIEPQNQDHDEATSPIMPHLRITDALNPENRFVQLARKRGVTCALSAPGESNLLSGQSALIHLSNGLLEDVLLKFPVAVHANMGETPKLFYGAKSIYPSTRMGEAALLRQTLTDALAYLRKRDSPKPPDRDPKLEALRLVLSGELPLMVRANRRDDILTILRIAEEYHIKLILNHGSDAYRLAERLASRHIPVVVGPFFAHQQREETTRATLQNPKLLNAAGVKIAFQTGSFKNHGDLLYQAETAVKNGLPMEEAWKALTIYAAEIFGMASELGSLEKGKQAHLVVYQGNPLESIAPLRAVIINGQILEKF